MTGRPDPRIDETSLADAIERNKAAPGCFETLHYTRLLEPLGDYPRGTVVLPDGSVVPGYPSIGRVQSLAAGLRKHYSGPFWAEEKIDGFNVRILRHEGTLYALSRGGFVCPFSTDRLPDLLDPGLFDDDPALVLCAEIAGPDNPYLEGHPPQVEEDVALFVFDMMRRGGAGFLPQEEKMALIERYRLPATRIFGRYGPEDVERLSELILQLDAQGSEGLVFKGETDGRRAKYVTGRSNITDIALCSEQLLDLPPEYFSNRLLRLALFANEHGQHCDAELERGLGRAFLAGLDRAIERSRAMGRVGVGFRCRFRKHRNARHFVDHLKATGGRRIQLAPDTPRRAGDYWILEFERVLDRTTGTLATILAGGSQFD